MASGLSHKLMDKVSIAYVLRCLFMHSLHKLILKFSTHILPTFNLYSPHFHCPLRTWWLHVSYRDTIHVVCSHTIIELDTFQVFHRHLYLSCIYYIAQESYRTFSSLLEVLFNSTSPKCPAHIVSYLIMYDLYCLAQIAPPLWPALFCNRILSVLVLWHLPLSFLEYNDLKMCCVLDCYFHLFHPFVSLVATNPMPCTE